MDAYLFPGWECQLHLSWGKRNPQGKKKRGGGLSFFTSKHHGRRNTSFCLLTLAIAMALRGNATASLQAPCLSTNDVCHIPFCPCSAVSQSHPQNNKSFAMQCHSSMRRRRCTVKSGKFPVWRMETCPRGSSRDIALIWAQSLWALLQRTPWQGQGQSVVG